MLSYRHAYHAGNYADVLKHLVQVYCLDYMTRKNKPLRYIDTHSGAGMYQLDSAEAQKTAEWEEGIGRLASLKGKNPLIDRYLSLVGEANRAQGEPADSLKYYPGSPWFAAQCLRECDTLLLSDLHSTDLGLLKQNFRRDKRVQVAEQDGFKRMIAALPAPEKRAFILIDPSYEIKSDYQSLVTAVKKAQKRMATAVIAVWYPVVSRQQSEGMLRGLAELGEVTRFEMGISEDSERHGMTAAGMLLLNAPWGLKEATDEAMALVAPLLDADKRGFYQSSSNAS